MILSDAAIKARVKSDRLIEFDKPGQIKFCGCELTLGKAVAPQSGDVLSVAKRGSWYSNVRTAWKCFVIEPSDTLILVTREKINMPKDLCATYGQLNRLANKGLLILNTSIVEPGYSGPLSCVLVNFSSQRHALSPGDPIAKLTFHQISGEPEQLLTDKFTHQEYEKLVAKNSTCLPKSLLDISGIEERVTQKMGVTVKRSVAFGGVIVLVLLLWSQLEGFLSEWIYKRTGFMDTKIQVEKHVDTVMDDRLKQQQKQIDEQKQQIMELQNEAKAVKGKKGP